MFRKIFLKLTLLAGFCITPMYGNDCGNCCFNCCDVLETGFLAGAYGSFHTFHIRTRDTFEDEDDRLLFEHDDIQRAPGGGGYIGYGCSFCDRFVLAFKAGVTGFASEARHGFFSQFEEISYATEERVKYVVDFSVQPGAFIGNCFLMYVKFGGSYIDIRQKAKFIEAAFPFETLFKFSNNHNEWGFVFGYGARVSLTQCVSAFAESEWHSYPFSSSNEQLIGGEVLIDSRINSLWSFGFNAGLSIQF